MQENRSNFGIAWADNGRLFAIGGQTGSDTITATVEMLNLATMNAADESVNGGWSGNQLISTSLALRLM